MTNKNILFLYVCMLSTIYTVVVKVNDGIDVLRLKSSDIDECFHDSLKIIFPLL